MKTVLRSLSILLILFSATLTSAGGLRVMVSPFESKPADKELAREVTIMIAADVMRSEEYIYRSNTEVISDVIGAENMAGLKFTDLEDEYSEKKMQQLDKVIEPHSGFHLVGSCLAAADVTIGGKVERHGDEIKVELDVFDMKSPEHYTYSDTVECDKSRLEKEVLSAVRSLLKKILKGQKVYADRFTDKKLSKVTYVITTVDMRKLEVEMDYTGDRPDPDLQNVNIIPPEDIDTNGTTTLKVRSQEGKVIDIIFDYKLGKLNSIRVDTAVPDPSNKRPQSETLIVKSDAGYSLKFDFVWDDGAIENVRLFPVLNPFGGHEEA